MARGRRNSVGLARNALVAAVLMVAASRHRRFSPLWVGTPVARTAGLRDTRDLQPRRRTALYATEAARFLPPLESLEPTEASKRNGTFVLPCFPLRLAHAALPGEERTLNINEPRYVAMYNDMLQAGQSGFVVPRLTTGSEGTSLAEAAVVFHLADIRDGPRGGRTRYVCQQNVGSPVRIVRVLNPAAFQDKSTYLLAECEEIVDADEGRELEKEEEELLKALHQVAVLRERLGDSLRRWELQYNAHGQPVMIDNHLLPTVDLKALKRADAGRESGIWHLAGLWQGYCERRMIALRQWGWRSSSAARQDLGRGHGSKDPKEVAELKQAYEADAVELGTATSDLLTRLLQAPSHAERLAVLRAAAEEEACRLAAAGVIQSAVGGEPLA